ncbi:MAG: hypothetical protein HQK92_14880 [Nitrospirae bacterium]|nr:hypothetical protein [Nitrospirota bacterium]
MALGEKYEYENFEYNTRNHRFKLIFQKAIEQILKYKYLDENNRIDNPIDDKAKLVIFIDDLDRCEEETISKLLREIKQYLTTKRCVFVFGYDKHHVEKALAVSIKRSSKETRSYLEKLFQSTIYIKQPTKEKYKEFICTNLSKYDFISDTDIESLAEYLCDIIDPNPRRIKAFFTAFYIHVKNSAFCKSNAIALEDLEKLSLMTYLKVFHEPVYAALENKNDLLDDLIYVLQMKNRQEINNHNQYFIYLEMRSHLKSYVTDQPDVTIVETTNEEFMDNSENAEQKFLTEVYEMQGKHKSFEHFSREFKNNFVHIAEKRLYADIQRYL